MTMVLLTSSDTLRQLNALATSLWTLASSCLPTALRISMPPCLTMSAWRSMLSAMLAHANVASLTTSMSSYLSERANERARGREGEGWGSGSGLGSVKSEESND